jgi:crotonobetainyl-CoA:carnitine CoA-transferase CaiB-like acyl-CoA transferase
MTRQLDYPLKGIKVVEVSTWAAGPSCGMWRAEWGPLFTEAQMAWGSAQTALEATNDPCVLENNYIMEYEHPIHGKVKGIGCPIQLSKSPYRTPTCAPEYNQHTEEILQELGYSWDDIGKLKDEKVIL